MYAFHNHHHHVYAHQWISDLLGADAVESPDHNQVWGEEVPGRYEREKEDNGACDVDSPDITIEDKVLEGEPGDVDDDEEGEGGDAASLGGGQGGGRVVITRYIA